MRHTQETYRYEMRQIKETDRNERDTQERPIDMKRDL